MKSFSVSCSGASKFFILSISVFDVVGRHVLEKGFIGKGHNEEKGVLGLLDIHINLSADLTGKCILLRDF